MAPNTENLKENIESIGKKSKHDESIQDEKKTNEPPLEQSMTQESFLGYFNLRRQGTKHQITKKKTRRRSGRLSNPNYDVYKTIGVQKFSPPEVEKKLQCPSCDIKYSRRRDLSAHFRKNHEGKDPIIATSTIKNVAGLGRQFMADAEIPFIDAGIKAVTGEKTGKEAVKDGMGSIRNAVHLSLIDAQNQIITALKKAPTNKKVAKAKKSEDSSIEKKAAIVKSDGKTCIPCGKTYLGKNAKWHLKRHEQSLVHTKTLNYGGNNDKSSLKNRGKLGKAEMAKKLDLSDTDEEDFHGFTDVEPHIKLKGSDYIF